MSFWTWNTSHSKGRVRPKMSAVEHNDKDLPLHASHPSEQLPTPSTRTKVMSRRKSLTLLTATPNIPIPPSLRHSPYLTSSIFSQSLYSPSSPSDEDEKWLQDTIPIISTSRRSLATEGGSSSGDRRGSIIHLSRRAAQKTSEETIEESQNMDCDVYAGLGLPANTTRTDSLAPPSLLLVPDVKGSRSSMVNRRRWSSSPRRSVAFNLDDPFPRN